jgi:hypothetical protein
LFAADIYIRMDGKKKNSVWRIVEDMGGVAVIIPVIIAAAFARAIVKQTLLDTTIMLLGGGVTGLICGLLPYYVGKNRSAKWAKIALYSCAASGLALGILLALPVAVAFCVAITVRCGRSSTCDSKPAEHNPMPADAVPKLHPDNSPDGPIHDVEQAGWTNDTPPEEARDETVVPARTAGIDARKKLAYAVPAVAGVILIIVVLAAALSRPSNNSPKGAYAQAGQAQHSEERPIMQFPGVIDCIGWSRDGEASVILDGEIHHEGDTVKGFKILKIHEHSVEFERDGEVFVQKI